MKHHRVRQLAWHLSWLCLTCLTASGLSGCSLPSSQPATVIKCLVSIEGQPAQDIRIVLRPLAASDPQAVLEGVTDHQGIANMQLLEGSQLPTTEVMEMRAAVESLGDYQIIKPWSELESSPLKVSWTAGAEQIEIDLPKKSVRTW